MANDVPITITAGTLPSGAVYNAQTYFNAIAARMSASVSGGNVIWGQLGGGKPTGPLAGNASQSGLWFGSALGGSGYFNAWNVAAATYLPIPVVAGAYVNATLRTTQIVCGAMTGNWTVTTPDAGGTMALLSDMIQMLGTQTPSGTTVQVDWNNRASVYVVMTGNITITALNAKDGLIMDFWLENRSGTSTYTLNMPGVEWPSGGAVPTLSAGVSGQRVIDHVRCYHTGGYLFGEMVAKNFQIATGADTSIPAPLYVTGLGNQITVTMNSVLTGASLNVAGFSVFKNGATDPISSASCNGQTVTVVVANKMLDTDTVTIRYSGTDMKSIAGNTVPAFGWLTVSIVGGGGNGGGIHNDVGPTGIAKSPV